ncbi:amidase signature domain-containing protein [Suillus discolor]|uniref:Amidase signature domain-containing protein n=1 Tax=Suillus discolor TaxID=1912936 RepID=A0A9P7EZR8_9AGAM|nr:amidase signature domain-containing protein [Suillus discolor]KAG2097013.1 amidase signature domain-containing protein [Suillus discolor]
MFFQSQHRRDCAAKQEERRKTLDGLPSSFFEPCTEPENKVLDLSLSELVQRHNAGSLSTASILNAYGKKVVSAQKATNCLTGIMIQEALVPKVPAPSTGSDGTDIPEQPAKLLSGVPVSIKDCIDIEGYDTTIGYSSKVNHPASSSAAIVRLLHDAGAITHVKTTVPPGLLGLETSSDLFGRTSNPYNKKFSSGASTGGGGALLACRGSVIEIGTDLGGSVRLPAHYCGLYAMRSSIGRFPCQGTHSPVPGLESVATTSAPMSRRLEDLEEFWKRVVEMRPWEYDHTCVPLPWRPVNLQETKLKFGVVWEDGIVSPSPACRRALEWACDALEKQGHEVVDFVPPSIPEGLNAGLQLCFGDGGAAFFGAVRKDEKLDPVMVAIKSLLGMPLWLKKFMAMVTRKSTGDEVWASMLETIHLKSPAEERVLVVSRDEYREKWHQAWEDEKFDFLLTVPHSLPAIPAGTAEKVTLVSAAYTMIFNILDFAAGVLPVSFVDRQSDGLPKDFMKSSDYKKMGLISKGAYSVYDADKMHGLPLGVQVVGRRFEEEKVLQGMKIVEDALEACGRKFIPREF